MRDESRKDRSQARAVYANDPEWVAATDEVTRETETLARSVDAFTGTGAYFPLPRRGVVLIAAGLGRQVPEPSR
jgi:hypothetical protein